jgi:hypothetical protein
MSSETRQMSLQKLELVRQNVALRLPRDNHLFEFEKGGFELFVVFFLSPKELGFTIFESFCSSEAGPLVDHAAGA